MYQHIVIIKNTSKNLLQQMIQQQLMSDQENRILVNRKLPIKLDTDILLFRNDCIRERETEQPKAFCKTLNAKK